MFAWLRAGWLAKLSACLLWASSLLARKFDGLIDWLIASLFAPHRLRYTANLCVRRAIPCKCLTNRQRGRESENAKGKGKRMEREQGNERERRGRGRAGGRGEIYRDAHGRKQEVLERRPDGRLASRLSGQRAGWLLVCLASGRLVGQGLGWLAGYLHDCMPPHAPFVSEPACVPALLPLLCRPRQRDGG